MQAPLHAGPSQAASPKLLSGPEPLAHMKDDAVGKRLSFGLDIAEALIERDVAGHLDVGEEPYLREPQFAGTGLGEGEEPAADAAMLIGGLHSHAPDHQMVRLHLKGEGGEGVTLVRRV